MKVKSKILSLLLAFAMIVSLFPATALAADETHDPTNGPHKFTVLVKVMSDGDCSTGTNGIGKYQCEVAGCKKTAYQEMLAVHKAPDGVEPTKPATCGEAGSMTYTCNVCKQEVVEAIPATGEHTAGPEKLIPATCTEPAKFGTSCSVCGAAMADAEEVTGSKPLGHNYEYKILVTVECGATDDNGQPRKGSRQLTCTRCGAVGGAIEETEAATEHAWVEVEDTYEEATCQHAAQATYRCTACGKTEVQTVMVGTGENAKPVQAQLKHNYVGATETEVPATCNKPAQITKACQNEGCNHVETTDKPGSTALTHLWGTPVVHAPTCEEDGYTETTCTHANCDGKGDSTDTTLQDTKPCTKKTNVITADAKYHKVDMEKSKLMSEDDCSKEQDAIYKAVCEYCGSSMGYKTMPYKHEFGDPDPTAEPKTPATCIAKAKYELTCAKCGETMDAEYGEYGDHNWDDSQGTPGEGGWVITLGPTCKAGSKTRKCLNEGCSFNTPAGETQPIPATSEHEYKFKKEQTCEGNFYGEFCIYCGEPDPDAEGIIQDTNDKAAHDYVVCEEKSKEATCGEAGVEVKWCKWCHEYFTDATTGYNGENGKTIPATEAHEADEATETIVTDCAGARLAQYTCKNCGTLVTEEIKQGTGTAVHTWGKVDGKDPDEEGWVVTKAGSCTETGVKTRVCENCGFKEEDVAESSGHTWNDFGTEMAQADIAAAEGWVVTTPATCGDGGKATLKKQCTVAGCPENTEQTKTENAAAGHTLGAATNVPANCKEAAHTVQKCSVCGAEVKTPDPNTQLNPNNHKWDETKKKTMSAANCATETKGIVKQTCELCGKSAYEEENFEHNFPETVPADAEPTTAATCTHPAKYRLQCQNPGCEALSEDELERGTARGHQWDDFGTGKAATTIGDDDEIGGWIVLKEATCGEGFAKRNCTDEDCDGNMHNAQAEEKVLHGTGKHSYVAGEDKDATCTEPAKSGGRVCETCGEPDPKAVPGTVTGSTALGHKWDKWVERTAATCTKGGEEELYCARCDMKAADASAQDKTTGSYPADGKTTRTTEPNGHTMPETGYRTELGNCTTKSGVGYTCTVCHEETFDEFPAGPMQKYREDGKHVWYEAPTGEGEEADPTKVDKPSKANCTYGARTEKYCTVCEKYFVDPDSSSEGATDPDVHVYDDEIVYLEGAEPTCTTSGVQVLTCKYCGDVKYVNVEVAHTWDNGKITTPATCTADGVKTFTCTICGTATKTEEISRTGHDYPTAEDYAGENRPANAPACKTVTIKVDCKNGCNEKGDVELAATATCTYEETEVAANCNHGTLTGSVCKYCGEAEIDKDTNEPKVTEADDKLEHQWDNGTVTKEADCKENGVRTYTCTREGCEGTSAEDGSKSPATRTETIKGGHVWGSPKYNAATCTTGGTVVRTCTRANCPGEGEGEDKVQPAQDVQVLNPDENGKPKPLGHNPVEEIVTPATCSADGLKQFRCSRCHELEKNEDGTVKTEKIDQLKHSWKVLSVLLPATCTAEGAQRVECENCDEKTIQAIPMLEHDLVVDAKGAPVVTVEGTKSYNTCKNCDTKILVGDTSVTDCDHEGTTVAVADKPATCTEPGKTGVTRCTKCGATVSEGEEVEATGHKWGEEYISKVESWDDDGNPVVTETRVKQCENCKEVKAVDEIKDDEGTEPEEGEEPDPETDPETEDDGAENVNDDVNAVSELPDEDEESEEELAEVEESVEDAESVEDEAEA